MERIEHLPFKQLYEKEMQRLQDAECVRSARMEGMGLLLFINPNVAATSTSEDSGQFSGWDENTDIAE